MAQLGAAISALISAQIEFQWDGVTKKLEPIGERAELTARFLDIYPRKIEEAFKEGRAIAFRRRKWLIFSFSREHSFETIEVRFSEVIRP